MDSVGAIFFWWRHMGVQILKSWSATNDLEAYMIGPRTVGTNEPLAQQVLVGAKWWSGFNHYAEFTEIYVLKY